MIISYLGINQALKEVRFFVMTPTEPVYRVSAKMPLEMDSPMNHVGFRCVAYISEYYYYILKKTLNCIN